MSEIIFIPEPNLEFRYAQTVPDPRDGLSIFGPYDFDLGSHPKNISYGLVGTPKGKEMSDKFALILQSPIISEGKQEKLRLWPPFPGFEAAFASKFADRATRESLLDEAKLTQASMNNDPAQRAFGVVELYLTAIESLKKHEDPLDVILCVVPDLVYQNCRPRSYVKGGIGTRITSAERRQRAGGQIDLEQSYSVEPYQYSVDFRRQLKARCMKYEIPVQIVLESTLQAGVVYDMATPRKTPLSDRAWNLSTTLFYKAGGKPWRLSTSREGVCYVGITYRRTDPTMGDKIACCAAQMFLDTGDGVVIRGEYGKWYSETTRQFHLSKKAARDLLVQVLSTYSSLHGKPLREVFLHYRASIDDTEYEGFKSACPEGVKLVGVRVRQERDDLRLFREGRWPIVRGTFWKVNPRQGFLWSSGFKPRLATYDGWETPVPLSISVQYGDTDIIQVATDILGLTKLNYNECRLGDANPVTIGFSNDVGEILVSNPKITSPNPKFKFYI